jgi:hypothetical protein
VLPADLASCGVECPRPVRIVNDIVEIGEALFVCDISQNVDVPVREPVCREDIMVRNYIDPGRIPDFGVLTRFPQNTTVLPGPQTL